MERPKQIKIDAVNWESVKTKTEKYLSLLELGKYKNNDQEHYIFEAVMEALYGEDVWEYVNSIMI